MNFCLAAGSWDYSARIWCRESLHPRALLAFPQWVDCVAPRWALCWQSIALLITGMPVCGASAGLHDLNHNAPTLLDHVLTQAHSSLFSLQILCQTSRCHLQGIESFGGGWAPPVHTQVTPLPYQHPTIPVQEHIFAASLQCHCTRIQLD